MKTYIIIVILLIVCTAILGISKIISFKENSNELNKQNVNLKNEIEEIRPILEAKRNAKNNLEAKKNELISEKNRIIKNYNEMKQIIDKQNMEFMNNLNQNIEMGDFNGNGIPDYIEH